MSRLPKLFALAFSVCMSVTALSQTVADQWISMPNEYVPYLTVNQKKEMIECQKIGVDTSVKNKLEGTTSIDTLTADYGKFLLSDTRDIQLLRLLSDADTIFCMIDTYKGPEAKSMLRFYDVEWKELSGDGRIDSFSMGDFLHKPDTVSVEEYNELRRLLVPELIAYNYDLATQTLTLTPSLPFLTTEERQKVKAVLCEKRLKWNERMFK